MKTIVVHAFLSGAIAIGFMIIGMFFLSFWRQTRDRLFVMFSSAFMLLAIERVILILVSPINEFRPFLYSVRLLAFALIIAAIADRNRPPKP